MWIGHEWTNEGDLYRLVVPCCEFGCVWPDEHAEKKCEGTYKPLVSNWPDDWPFTTVKIDDPSSEIQKLAQRCKWMWRRVHCVYDALSGLTQACTKTAREVGMEDDDFVRDDRRCPEFLPRALVFGPVPFDIKSVAEVVLQRALSFGPDIPEFKDLAEKYAGHTSLRPTQNVVRVEGNTYLAKCEYAPPYVTKVPYGTRVVEWLGTHKDESTHARVRLRGPYVDKKIVFKIETTDGRTFDSPKDYIDAWLSAKLNAMEDEMLTQEVLQHRTELVRSIVVASKFADEHNQKKRKWVDECVTDKRARIAEEFGDEFVDALLETPLKLIGPDFGSDAPAAHPRPELIRQLNSFLQS